MYLSGKARPLLVMLLHFAFISGTSVYSNFDVQENTAISNLPVELVSMATLLSCTMACLSRGCLTASYLTTERKCYLSYYDDCKSTIESSGYTLITVPKREFIYVPNQNMTWKNAQKHCNSLGGQLARIYTSCENERAKNLTPQTSPVWIDGTDIVKEGRWLFSDGSKIQKVVKFDFWGPRQPNNNKGVQHCMSIYYFPVENVFEWADEHCDKLYEFICEI